MPVDQLDVFLALSITPEHFFKVWVERFETEGGGDPHLIDEDNQPVQFLRKRGKARTVASDRNVPYALFDVFEGIATMGFYGDFAPKCKGQGRWHNYFEAMLPASMLEWRAQLEADCAEDNRKAGQAPPKLDLSHDPTDVLRRAYMYLHAALGFMDYDTSDELHRVFMPIGSYEHLQRIGEPVPDSPLDVKVGDLTLVLFNHERIAEICKGQVIRPTAGYHGE